MLRRNASAGGTRMATGQIGVMARKLAAARGGVADGGPGADRAWRLALARAARDQLKLPLEVADIALDRLSLAEVLELPPDHAMIVVLEGPRDGLGLMVIGAGVLAAMIEVQTIGNVAANAPSPRKPTRTDAAMVAPLIEAALVGLETALMQEPDLIWAGGFRYASFLDDPRPLGLLLEDTSYRVLRAQVSVANGVRSGPVLLALPAEGRGAAPLGRPVDPALLGPVFTALLADQVENTDCVLDAVLTRLSMPLSQVLGMAVGDVVGLPRAGLERISFEGLDGRVVAVGRLGQNRGLRAVRLTPAAEAARQPPVQASPSLSAMVPMSVAETAEPMRQSA